MTGENHDQVHFYAENVEVLPGRRRTIKLIDTEGSLLGYASWVLAAADHATLVEYHVYSALPSPQGDDRPISSEQRAQHERETYETNRSRFGKELEALKRLVENQHGSGRTP